MEFIERASFIELWWSLVSLAHYMTFLKKVGQPRPLFVYFRSFQTQYYRKTLGFSGIRTRIVGVEGEHADHLTTTSALTLHDFLIF